MRKPVLITLGFAVVLVLAHSARTQTLVSTFAGNPQHTANYNPAAQDLNAIHWSTKNLNKGNHPITAVYGGSTNFLTSTSPVVTQVVH